MRPEPVTLVELRVLDGPNLYFTRPAIKLTLAVPGWMASPEPRAAALATRLGLHAGPGAGPGPSPAVPRPDIPVIAVTGTNGKTTTVRLVAHIGRTAGLRVAYSSTDGVYFDENLIEEGDYSGFGGAGQALTQPGVQLAVLETARGGILLRGIGTAHNDVAVVTNVSADHL